MATVAQSNLNINPAQMAKLQQMAKTLMAEEGNINDLPKVPKSASNLNGSNNLKKVPIGSVDVKQDQTSSVSETNLAKSSPTANVAQVGGDQNGFSMFGFTIPTQTLYLIIAILLIAVAIWYFTKPTEKASKKKKRHESKLEEGSNPVEQEEEQA